MKTNVYGRPNNPHQPFRIQRLNEKELNLAISDLIERGYEVVKRGVDQSEHKSFNYRENQGQKFRFTSSETRKKCWAIMKRMGEAK